MHPIFIQKQLELQSLSGVVSKSYIHLYQDMKSISYVPQIMRQGTQKEAAIAEPIGDPSRIPKKIKHWEPNLVLNSDIDPSDDSAPEKQENIPTETPTGSVDGNEDTHHEAFLDQGYMLDNDGIYRKMISKDTTPLAAYGYYIQKELVTLAPNEQPIEMTSAYNYLGHYIGTPEDAEHLCVNMGIIPQLASEDHKVCSVGFCHRDNKWYGWSHRAISGFSVGDSVEPGHCAYVPDTMESAVESVRSFYNDDMPKDVEAKYRYSCYPVGEDDECFKVKVVREKYSDQEHARDRDHEHIQPEDMGWTYDGEPTITQVPKGRGAWKASNMEDVFEMARDFAQSVSASTDPICFVGSNFDTDLETVSAAAKNPLDYAWYRYVGSRKRNFKNHHRTTDLTLENGEKFGIRKRGQNVFLVESESMDVQFKLSVREAQSLLKVAKPFGGKVSGINITRGNGDLEQMRGADKKVPKHTQGRRDAPKRDTTIEKPKVAAKPRDKDITYFGFFKQSTHQDKIAFVEEETIALVKERLDKFMANNSRLGSAATIYRATGNQARGLSLKIGNKPIGYILGPVYTNMSKNMRPVVKEYVPKGVVMYDETIQVPAYNESKFVPKEPIYYGNETAALEELQAAVIQDKFFTGLFSKDKQRLARETRVRNSAGGIPSILFVSSLVNNKTINEANTFIKRVKRVYGDAIVGKVQVLGNEKISVRLSMPLIKTSPAQQKRTKAIDKLVKNTERKSVNTRKINMLLQDIKLATPADKTRMQREIEKLSNELADEKVLAYDIPIYSIPVGQGKFNAVELSRVNVSQGAIFIKPVRDRKLDPERQVKALFTLDGSMQVL